MPHNKPKNVSMGELGEELACRYLKDKGYKILTRNFSNRRGVRLGEIDIVASQGKCIVFVEVKTRRQGSQEALPPEANINRTKLHRLQKIAEIYLKDQRQERTPYRFDAVSVLYDEFDKRALIKHIESIFI